MINWFKFNDSDNTIIDLSKVLYFQKNEDVRNIEILFTSNYTTFLTYTNIDILSEDYYQLLLCLDIKADRGN